MLEYILAGIAVLLMILGVVVWRWRLLSIVAGYDASKTRDREGLARWIGLHLILMGILTWILAMLPMLLEGFRPIHALIAHIIAVFAISVLIIRGTKRFES